MIPETGWEDRLLGAVRQYFAIQANIGVTPPIVVMLGLLNVKGVKMFAGDNAFPEDHTVDRDPLSLYKENFIVLNGRVF